MQKIFGDSISFRLRVFAYGLIFISIGGCGSSIPMGDVSGKVTVNGETYSDASLVFLSLESGAGSSADIGEGGSFELPDPLPTGTYRVFLAPRSIPEEENGQPTPVQMDKTIPAKFWNESTTDISATVKEGVNNLPIKFDS